MGRLLVFVVAMMVGAVGLFVAPARGAWAVTERYADRRADLDSCVRPTHEQSRIRHWWRMHLAELARPVPVDEPPPPPRRARARRERIVEHAPGALPVDAMAIGESALRLHLVDSETLLPVRAGVSLWRLFVDGDETYGPGDEVRWSGISDDGEISVSGLPEGTYRIESNWLRRGADDPQAFYVSADAEEVTVRLQMPRTFDVHVRAFELDGTELSEVDVRRGGHGSNYDRDAFEAPRWADPREPVAATRRWPQGGAYGCGVGDDAATRRKSTPSGVLLSRHREPDQCWAWSSGWYVSRSGAVEVECVLRSEDFTGNVTFAAPLVPLELVTQSIRLPDGSLLVDSAGEFTASCLAVVSGAEDPQETWRRAEVEVRVPRVGERGHYVYRWRLGASGEEPSVERLEDTDW